MHAAIMDHLSRQTEPVTVAHVARALGTSAYDTRQALHDLVDEGRAVMVMVDGGERFALVT